MDGIIHFVSFRLLSVMTKRRVKMKKVCLSEDVQIRGYAKKAV